MNNLSVKQAVGDEKVAQLLKALTALAEDLGSVLSTHIGDS